VIDARYQPVLFAFFMSLTMAFLMSGVLSAIHLGLVPGFVGSWMRAFALTWPIAFPLVLFSAPQVRKLVEALSRTRYAGVIPGPRSGPERRFYSL
jgi:Protein of unknown function (DUF2798)